MSLGTASASPLIWSVGSVPRENRDAPLTAAVAANSWSTIVRIDILKVLEMYNLENH